MDDQEVATVACALDVMTEPGVRSVYDIARAVIEALDEHRAAHPLPQDRPGREELARVLFERSVVWTYARGRGTFAEWAEIVGPEHLEAEWNNRRDYYLDQTLAPLP